MRPAIVLAVILLVAQGPLHAQELGVSTVGGYSIPGESRLFGDSDWFTNWDEWSGTARRPSAHIDFHLTQMGPVFGGDLFFRVKPCDVGLGAFIFSSGQISGSLLSAKARGEEATAVDFERSFKTAFGFFRYRAVAVYPVMPYLGAGIGIYGLRESVPGTHSEWEKGTLIQIVAGIEARTEESFSGIFVETRVNFAMFDEDPKPGQMAFATFTVAIGLRFAH